MEPQKYLEKSISYKEYRDWIDNALADGKTSGENHSEAMLHYTKMNVARMARIEKTFKPKEVLLDIISNLKQPIKLLALTEAWCGDAAQNLPVFAKLAEENPNLDLRLVFRDENLDLMDQHLTNGGRGIPKVIALDQEGNTLFSWGPRPASVQAMVIENKMNPASSYDEFSKKVQLWYAKDKQEEIQGELIQILKKWDKRN